jgi:hypothetical protein
MTLTGGERATWRVWQTRLAQMAVLVLLTGCGGGGGGQPPTQEVGVTVSPAATTLTLREQKAFTAAVTGATNTGVTWTVQEGSAGGAVTTAGLYTAPAAPGTYHVVANSVADLSKSATATVTVEGGNASGTIQ